MFRSPNLKAPVRTLIVAAGIAAVIGFHCLTASTYGLVAGLSVTRYGPEAPPQDPVLQGAGDVAVPFRCEITVVEKGGYLLSWPEVEEATSYRVVVYRADLEKLMDHDVGAPLPSS